MTYRMFIDDERFPPNYGNMWTICRNAEDVQREITRLRCPTFISFDHDLGDGIPTGYDIAKWMVEQDLNSGNFFPSSFSFYVHSQNPVGKKNIVQYLNQYLRLKELLAGIGL